MLYSFIITSEEVIFIASISTQLGKYNIPKTTSIRQAMHLFLRFESMGFNLRIFSQSIYSFMQRIDMDNKMNNKKEKKTKKASGLTNTNKNCLISFV